ncbi:MAG: WD40 repeat domain-containing protein, partial [Terriglobales bacterium]
DVATGKAAGELKEVGHVWALAFAPDGKSLATAGQDQTLRLWNPATGTELRRFQGAKNKWVCLAFSSDGKVLASVNTVGDSIQLWDVATGEALRAFKVGPGWERNLAFSPDGKTLAAANYEDKLIRLWDVPSGKTVREIAVKPGTSALAFSPDGKMLATGDSRQEGKILTP